jgi:hypothetical protein
MRFKKNYYMHCCHTFGSSMGKTLSQWNAKPLLFHLHLPQSMYTAEHRENKIKFIHDGIT